MRLLVLALMAAALSGCTSTQPQTATRPVSQKSYAYSEPNPTERKKVVNDYINCTGKASIAVAAYSEDIDALAETAAQKCLTEESSLRNFLVRYLGQSEGSQFADEMIRKNHRFNVSVIVETRQRLRATAANQSEESSAPMTSQRSF